MSDNEDERKALDYLAQNDTERHEYGVSFCGRDSHLITYSSNATEESRELDLKHSKDYCSLRVSDKKKVCQKELDCSEFDKNTIKVTVKGKSILVHGTKKIQLNEATMTVGIPDQCDLDRVEAGFRSNDILYIRFPSRNEPAVEV